ncbi:MAG: hypothetical protein KGZ25_15460, partial [Planctomycetes bacterium]|nr:hypothetical protein [Planctomycetota bacterium]
MRRDDKLLWLVSAFALAIFLAGSPARGEWKEKIVIYRYSERYPKRPPEGTPSRAVWKLMKVAEKGEKKTFCSLFHNISNQQCDELFELWGSRMSDEELVDFMAVARRGKKEACVILTLWWSEGADDRKGSKFTGVLYLRKHAKAWKIHVEKLDEETETYLQKALSQEVWDKRHSKRLEKNAHETLRELAEEQTKREMKYLREALGKEEFEKWQRWDKFEKEMEKQGKRIPDSFKEMLKIYNATLYSPPLTFSVEDKPESSKKTGWKYGFRNAMFKQWKKHGLARCGGKGDIQVLATVEKVVEGRKIIFVFFNGVNFKYFGEKRFITGAFPIEKQKDGTFS